MKRKPQKRTPSDRTKDMETAIPILKNIRYFGRDIIFLITIFVKTSDILEEDIDSFSVSKPVRHLRDVHYQTQIICGKVLYF